MTTLREAAQQALETLEALSGAENILWVQRRAEIEVEYLRAALAQEEQEPVAMLWKIREALALASAICDRVPTRWHHTHEIGSAEADIGDMVNAHPDGTHGYLLIKEAEAELVAYLTTPEATPPRMIVSPECAERGCAAHDHRVDGPGVEIPRREWQGLSEGEIVGCDQRSHGNTDWGKKRAFARAIEQALKERNT
jgi:hypothetical protein